MRRIFTKNVSIKTKIITAPVFLVLLISSFTYFYFPKREKEEALQHIYSQIERTRDLVTTGVGIGMGDMDFVAISKATHWAISDSSVIYLAVIGNKNQLISEYNPKHFRNKVCVPV